jgi:hypothetical protein
MPLLTPVPPRIWTSFGLSANGFAHAKACDSAARSPSCVIGVVSSTRAARRRGVGSVAASTISSNGVMPAIGSFEN